LTTLANFGKAYYGLDYTSVSNTNVVVINGVTYTIGASPNYVAITMVNNKGATLATPSSLSTDGTSFYVSYTSSTATAK
jgi:hypothetical protein